MDQLFVDRLDFNLPVAVAQRCYATHSSMELALKAACEEVGIELIDYEFGHFIRWPGRSYTEIALRSRQWIERGRDQSVQHATPAQVDR